MSFDLAIWKRSATTKTAMLAEVYQAIIDGKAAHPAIAGFDLTALESALKSEFGDYSRGPEVVECQILCERGESDSGAWLLVQCAHADAASVIARVVPIALRQGLLVYDPQRGAVYGNKRPAKA